MAQNGVVKPTGFVHWGRTTLLARPKVVAIAYLVALVIAEALTTLISPRTGMVLHGLILISLLLLAALSFRKREYRFLVALALAPLIRLLSLALPLANFPFIFWYAVVGVPLFIATFMSARVTGLKRNMIGLRISWRALPVQLLIGSTGLAIGLIEYLILRPDPLIAEMRWELIWLPALILLLFTGFLEELIFRGVMQTSSLQELGRIGIIFVAVVFAVLHLGYRSILDMILVLVVAVMFGLVVQRFNSIVGVSISHGLTNISLYLVFPFLFAAPFVPTPLIPEPQPAPADIFSPAIITPVYSVEATPTPIQQIVTTPTIDATQSATEIPTSAPSATPTYTPTLIPTQAPIIWPTPLPTSTPTPTPTEKATPPLPNLTPTSIPPSETPTPGLPTLTSTPSVTYAPTLIITRTLIPNVTDTPGPGPTETQIPAATETSSLTATDTPPLTETYTPAPAGTDTPLPTATEAPPPTSTDVPPPTATQTVALPP